MIENVRASASLTIDADAAHELCLKSRPFVMDVRPRELYREAHIPGAVNKPLSDLGEDLSGLPKDLDAPILSVCQLGNASLTGVLFLKSLGYTNVLSIKGGTTGWREKGFATDSE